VSNLPAEEEATVSCNSLFIVSSEIGRDIFVFRSLQQLGLSRLRLAHCARLAEGLGSNPGMFELNVLAFTTALGPFRRLRRVSWDISCVGGIGTEKDIFYVRLL
jgi:hypothetical protein